MSIIAVWEFIIPASPRALAVYPAIAAKAATNPFDSNGLSLPETFSVVIGTDQGSLHARTYNKGGGSQNPLGTTPSSPRSSIPRHWLPLDLRSLPISGPVAHVVVVHQRYRQQQLYLLMINDSSGATSASDFRAVWVVSTVASPGFQVLSAQQQQASSKIPQRLLSCAVPPGSDFVVYTAGRRLATITELPTQSSTSSSSPSSSAASKSSARKRGGLQFRATLPGTIRGGPDALILTAGNRVAVCAVGNTFYAVPGRHGTDDHDETPVKIHAFQQTSQVHPVIMLDLNDESIHEDWSSLFLASGRKCAVVDMFYNGTILTGSKPRHETVTMASPILAASSSWPIVAILQSDGLVSIRSPSCLGISLRTVEVGQQPNDFFMFRNLYGSTVLAVAYSGVTKIVDIGIADSSQDMADRLMRHAMDAFGPNGFPRTELAEAIRPSFPATSYVGEATANSKVLLKQYLEAVLGLTDFESGAISTWPTDQNQNQQHHLGSFSPLSTSGKGRSGTSPDSLLTFSAMLCLVCSQLQDSTLANRAAQACAEKMGVGRSVQSPAATQVCEMVAERLLREAASQFSLGTGSSPAPRHASSVTDFVEAAIWLLRAGGRHERAIDVAYERLQLQAEGHSRGVWSQIKYESYTATHLSELWSAGDENTCGLVLSSQATHRLLENNPRLGLSVFTAMHPQNEDQWRSAAEDPLVNPERVYEVLKLLKSINPSIPFDKDRSFSRDETPIHLPLESGRAVAINFLRSAIGISTGRPIDEEDLGPIDETFVTHQANFHDELSFLLLEGVIAERPEDDSKDAADTELGNIYRSMLREYLKWPLAKIRTEQFMETLPPSFLQEKALILGRVGKHEEALRILYRDLESLELALEYCDDRFEQQKSQQDRKRVSNSPMYHDVDRLTGSRSKKEDNAYLPLVRVALESGDKERGTTAAIKVLSMRRGAIDRAAALRLLPSDIPVSEVARPFLIPALVDSESQVRRMTVVSSLLRSRYLRLKDKLTEAQLKAQANIHVVPALRSLNLGDPLHSTKSFRIRTTSSSPGSTMPYVEIVKHFFSRHLVIQAKVTNSPYSTGPSTYGGDSQQSQQILSDIAFVVAESSEEEAIQPMLQIPIQLLPPKLTGSAWCVLSASPGIMESPTAQLTCELRYAVQSGDANSATLPWSSSTAMSRTFVEELQDLEVHATHFS